MASYGGSLALSAKAARGYGLVYDYYRSWVAVVDVTKLLAAPTDCDPHHVSGGCDPITHGIVTYLPTGFSRGPASNGNARVGATRRSQALPFQRPFNWC